MTRMHKRAVVALLACAVCVTALAVLSAQGEEKKPGTYATFDTSMGAFTVRLMPEIAPKAVANFVGLAEGKIDPITGKPGKVRPYYNGVIFHRVIPKFMIQGGDPTGTGTGGPSYKLTDEFTMKVKFDRPGILAMANKGIPNSSGSQFFITVAPYPSLNGKYTPFGEVVSGQDVVNKISEVKRDASDRPLQRVVIRKITIERVK